MNKNIPKNLIIDVDGVLSTGQFLYSEEGKVFKIFGRHDNDGLKILNKYFVILFISADKKGFQISKKRIVEDMGFKLEYVSEKTRYEFIKKEYGFNNTIYIGDGIFDVPILKKCILGLCPSDARTEAKKNCNFVLNSKAGEGALLDACIFIMKEYYFEKYSKIFSLL